MVRIASAGGVDAEEAHRGLGERARIDVGRSRAAKFVASGTVVSKRYPGEHDIAGYEHCASWSPTTQLEALSCASLINRPKWLMLIPFTQTDASRKIVSILVNRLKRFRVMRVGPVE